MDTYKLKRDCFVGQEGDIIEVDESGESSYWTNITRRTWGSPFIEYELVERYNE